MSIVDIKNFMLQFGLTEPAFNGAQALIPILQKLAFSGVQNVLVKEGTYTPNNDYLWLWQNIPPAQAPNFIFLQTPGTLNLSVSAGGSLLANASPVNKIFMLTMPAGMPAYLPDNIYLEGRTNTSPYPMSQGTPVDYYCLMAQAVF